MTAIVGPSGSGKTTLLNVLAQRYSRNFQYNIKSDIRVNDVPLNKIIFRRIGSFIQQDDILWEFSSARELLRFAARLRTQLNS